jgi:hypothetical protein
MQTNRNLPQNLPQRGTGRNPESRLPLQAAAGHLARRKLRRGLAPLEMVLVLPLLMFIMALMVNYATAACWKVRTLTAARQGMWRARMNYWRGDGDRHLPDWPTEGRISLSGGAPLTDIATLWARPEIDKAFLRGPTIVNEGPYPDPGQSQGASIGVRARDNMSITAGVAEGQSRLARSLPLLKNMRMTREEASRVTGATARDMGQFSYNLRHALVDNRWQFANMGYGWNWDRRSNGWYEIRNAGAWAQQQGRLQQADQNLRSFPSRDALRVLDRDEELMQFFNSVPEYCFRRPIGCSTDVTTVRLSIVNSVVASIQGSRGGGRDGFPDCLARRFLSMYTQQLQTAQNQMPQDVATIARVTPLIQQLQQFIGSLQ